MTPTKGQTTTYGSAFQCFNCDEFSPEGRTRISAEQAAHSAGWRLGLAPDHSHDAEIACPECVDLLTNPGPCTPHTGAKAP